MKERLREGLDWVIREERERMEGGEGVGLRVQWERIIREKNWILNFSLW